MNNLRDKINRFMQGRNGVDDLYKALLFVIFILLVVNNFLNSPVVSLITWAGLVWAISRALSKNIYKRKIENKKYLEKIGNPVKSKFSIFRKKYEDRKTHKYYKCKNCGTNLRLPKKKGTLMVKCPKCKNTFKVKIK
jgi:DNA-directed RNA polymerase subunit RPC12/RpoP